MNERPKSFSSLSVSSLRDELKRRGLSHKGTKRELIQRLQRSNPSDSKMVAEYEVRSREKKKGSSQNGDSPQGGGREHSVDLMARLEKQKERNAIVLWKSPLTTLYYFVREAIMLLYELGLSLMRNKKTVLACLLTSLTLFVLYHMEGPHQATVVAFEKQLLWCAYWVGLGILSSVGLGTGLHTFLLYLGPHIAAVTLAAFECMSVDFPSPPYPDDIICPETEESTMTVWTIMGKVRLEAFMWGAGTAIGELPPYFMARAARLSGQMDEEEQELEDLISGKDKNQLSVLERAKIGVHDLVQRVGFAGILLCASIPNPLFDLAGITCGHFLIPFWTFFGATLIGKAVIKMHIQKLFVIFTFSEHHVEQIVSLIKYIPYFGPSLQVPFKEYLQKQKAKLHHKPGTDVQTGSPSWLSWLFEKLVLVMVVFFVVSIINSMAQNYHKRLQDSSSSPSSSPSSSLESSPSQHPVTRAASSSSRRKLNKE